MSHRLYLLLFTLLIFSGCADDRAGKTRGPIRLGDSASIVTETDQQYLEDRVPDLKPPTDEESTSEEPSAPKETTPAAAPETSQQAASTDGNGLTVAFKEVTIFIPGISTKTYKKQDLQNANGASYELTDGSLAGKQLRISGGTVQKITQRYQTVIILKDGEDKLPLESLSFSSDWEALSGSIGAFAITGLEPAKLDFTDAKPAAIRNAVQQAARKKRLNRKDTQDWLDAVRNIREANQAPATVVLRSVSWRISGKDAKGKSFNKEIRIDVPL